jgi:DNA-binding transcriptional MocR family regulator
MSRFGIAETFVSVRKLADETGLSATDVQRQLRELDADGWVIRKEKGRGQYGRTIYTYEAMIPLCQPPAQSTEPPLCQPPAQSTEPPLCQPPASNVPNEGQRTDSLCQPPAQIRSDTDQDPDVCPSGTDPGLQRNSRKAFLNQIRQKLENESNR